MFDNIANIFPYYARDPFFPVQLISDSCYVRVGVGWGRGTQDSRGVCERRKG